MITQWFKDYGATIKQNRKERRQDFSITGSEQIDAELQAVCWIFGLHCPYIYECMYIPIVSSYFFFVFVFNDVLTDSAVDST